MGMSKWFLFLYVLLLTQFNGAASVARNIFILAGQSNMAGRGGVSRGKWDGNVPTECSPNPSILRLSALLIWELAHEPLHADIDLGKTCGIGPGMAFANEVLRAKGSGFGEVGLVPCAVGGTRIGEWGKGTRLYGELVRRARESVRGGGVIRALLWFQGESDTVRKEEADGYKGKFEKLVLDLRSDLHLPNLPVIQVALASGEGKFVDVVRKGQLDVKLPNVKCVDAKGLRLKEDGLHLTTLSEGGEETNEQGAVEIKVKTVHYRSPAGEDKQPKKEKVEVVHEIRDGGGSDFVDLDATAAVAHTLKSAKDAISGRINRRTKRGYQGADSRLPIPSGRRQRSEEGGRWKWFMRFETAEQRVRAFTLLQVQLLPWQTPFNQQRMPSQAVPKKSKDDKTAE
ncbi:carbohydrate esterase [Pyrus ussuriensis x Pyrus communis]|uniref:Carbohydrate esterase n=1 Tax=Pyrus ussuriensis x Pyrus communis TaxID=2448454 RepID=A0A5N5GUZ9_9ROSA|nr:carbohydrate esterase [Pyrus ussuriensis x Pyrus communis]